MSERFWLYLSTTCNLSQLCFLFSNIFYKTLFFFEFNTDLFLKDNRNVEIEYRYDFFHNYEVVVQSLKNHDIKTKINNDN